jgi:hypothetical protein
MVRMFIAVLVVIGLAELHFAWLQLIQSGNYITPTKDSDCGHNVTALAMTLAE